MLAILKHFYNVFFPIYRPFCRVCGRVKEDYCVEERVWNQVTGGLDCLCFRHFDELAKSKGIYQTWDVRSQPVGHSSPKPELGWPPNELSETP
jgi:hypothetical protein